MNDCGLFQELNGRAYEGCIPLNVSLELTLACNIRCAHCYNFDREGPRPATARELSLDEIRALMDDLRREGTLFLALTGGEAMMHPRFWEILDDAAARGFAVTLLSNGTLLTEAACDRLAGHANLWGVSLSVYGALAATHDAVTRSAGSFDRTMSGARRLAARGVRTALKYVVMKANAGETARFLELADAEGFEVSVDAAITGRYDGGMNSLATRVDAATLEELYRGPLRAMAGDAGRGSPTPSDDEFKCNCARGNAAVSAGGEVYPCIAAPIRAGSIREQRFGEIWRGSPVFQRIRGLGVADFKTCAPCELKPWCRRSPGAAYVLTGDYTAVDPWTCREAEILRDLPRT